MLDYRIYTFLTLYEEMNYRRTAELLNMTQPGVTQHIQYLERHYGVKLFSYDGKTLSRTEGAEVLKRHIKRILAEEKAILEEVKGERGLHLRVGATKTIGEFVLVPVVREFLRSPEHSIELMVDNTENLLKLLENCELDFAVVEGVFDKAQYGYHLYKKERFTGICGKNHPFAGKKVPMEQLFEQTVVIRERGSGTRRMLEQVLGDHGFSLNRFQRVLEISNFSVITDLVARNGAISFAFRPVASHNDALTSFEIEDVQIAGEFNFVYCNRGVAMDKIRALMGSGSGEAPE